MTDQDHSSLVDRCVGWIGDLSASIERIRDEFDDRINHCHDTGTSIRDYEQGLLALLEEFDDNYQSHFVDKLADIIAECEKSHR